MQHPENEGKAIMPDDGGSALWRWVRRIGFGVLGFLLVLMLVFQLPPVQNWLVQKVSQTLSRELETRVEVGYLYWGFFNRLVIKDFYVEDLNQDTLLYSKRLDVNFTLSPVVLLTKGPTIEKLRLQGARFNLRKASGARRTNLEIMLDRLFPTKEQSAKQKRPFRLDVHSLSLRDVIFVKEDQVKGEQLYASLADGEVSFRSLDFPGKKIDIQSIRLKEPIFRLDIFEGTPVAMETVVEVIDSSALQDTLSTLIIVDEFQMFDGQFSLHNYYQSPTKLTSPDELDYQHMDVFDIDMDIRCFVFEKETYWGEIQKIALKEVSGFELSELSARQALVSHERTELIDMKLKTPYSELGDTLIFRHNHLSDYTIFPDAVNMEARIYNTSVAVRDIMTFAPGLKSNNFFASNSDQVVKIDGEVRGRVNNLRGRNLDIRLSDGSVMEGSFSSRNLAVKDEEFLNLRLERLSTRTTTLRQLIPGINFPTNFDRLGRMNFKGNYDGFFADFVANGDLRTDIGRAVMDMRMNLKNGRGKANYSGSLSLIDFDLGKWTGNSDFGLVNFTSQVIDGKGLTGETVEARLTAEVQSFYFKSYNYQSAQLNGELKKNLFNGDFAIQDDNIDFSFRGLVNYQDSIPVFDFRAEVEKLDMQRLNLMDKDLVVAGNVDLNLRNDQFALMEGEISLSDLEFIYKQDNNYYLDTLHASSKFTGAGRKLFNIDSDVLKMEMEGLFDIEQIPDIIKTFFSRNYPKFWSRLNIPTKDKALNDSDYTYDIQIVNSKGLQYIFDENLGRLENISVTGFYNSVNDSLLVQLDILESFEYGNVRIENAALTFNALRDEGWLDVYINETVLNDKQTLEPVSFLSYLNRDTLDFGINYSSSVGILDNLNLEGLFYPKDSTLFEIQFKQSNLVILEMPWEIDDNNHLTFGKKYFSADNFTLKSLEREVVVESFRNQGVRVLLNRFDFDFINDLWDYEPLNFSGHFNAQVEVGNVFDMQNLQARVVADTFLINDDNFGALNLTVSGKDLEGALNGDLTISDGRTALLAKGNYNLQELTDQRLTAAERARQYFNLEVDIDHYPLCIAEYFIGDVISGTDGHVDGKLRFRGQPSLPDVSGNLVLWDGSVTVNYLKTTYTFAKGNIDVNNFMFDATGVTLRDKYGHTATVSGGIRHDHLKNLGLEARLRTQRFLALDTQKGDNKLFYGHALGQGDVRFSGPFDRIDIYINASVNDSTKIVIPISSEREASELKFIKFEDRRRTAREEAERLQALANNLTGVSLEMNLSIGQEAQLELVFNEQTGDIIKGSGRGDIRVVTPRNGDFLMYGDYTIERGEYLFTLYNVVNKKFIVRQGGYIQWTGDPFGAQINLEAEYRGLNTSVANFIPEYLANSRPEIKNEASKSTQITLIMQLQGDLMRPIINFDIVFPQMTGELKAYVDGKMNVLRRDQNELNRQVFGLIVVGQFLPANSAIQGSEILYNTVSEFVSNQLSLLLTELFSEFIADGRVLSGIDFDIAYNQYQNADLGTGQDFTRGDEFEVQLRQNFFNDRLSVLIGGNVDIGTSVQNPASTGTFVGNDVVIEYALNRDRSLKLKVYQRLQPDIGGGGRLQVGTGISFRREFDSFADFWKSLKRDAKKLKESDNF